MKNFYHSIFYFLYKLAGNSNQLSSVIPTMSFLQFLNILVLVCILNIVGLKSVNFVFEDDLTIYAIAVLILIFVFNLNYFTQSNRVKNILKVFDKTSAYEKKRKRFIVILYIIISILLFFIVAPLRYNFFH
ncbi:MAG: hypothetical protein ACJAT1_001883 [Marivirga sp.]|jgi:hypothetical protein